MVAMTGELAASISQANNPNITSDFNDYQADYWPPSGKELRVLTASLFTRNEPVSVSSRNINAVRSRSINDEFYNRIHITPNPIDVGNLLAPQDVTVNVWNAFIDSAQLLSSIDKFNDSGIVLTEPIAAPTLFAALEDRDYVLSMSTTGSPVIDASFTFNFPTQSPILKVTGRRVIVFPFRPNWKFSVNERYEWLTDVMMAYDSSEQRRSLRGSPRKSMSYSSLVLNQDRQYFENLLFDSQARVFALPVWTDGEKLTASAAALDTVINVNTDNRGYLVSGIGVIWESPLNFEVIEVVSFTSTSITLKDPLVSGWPQGALVYPLRTCRLSKNQNLDNLTPTIYQDKVSFEFVNPENFFTALDSTATYRSNPVYEDNNNWAQKIATEYKRKLDIFDSLTGSLVLDDESERPDVIRVYNKFINGLSERVAFVRWLYARQGRFKGIWFPSGMDDLTVVQTIGSTDTVIKVRFCNYAISILNKINRRDIRIQVNDGSVFYVRVVNATDNGDGTEDLVIETATGTTIDPANIVLVSFMAFSRLTADRVEIKYHTPEIAESAFMLKSLNDDV